jgi:hypothetical protein
MTDAAELRERAERLFALALQARSEGNIPLAEQLTALAVECLESAGGPQGEGDVSIPPTARVVPQVQQQQQQQQAEPEPGDDAT